MGHLVPHTGIYDHAIYLDPIVCRLLNADFDRDQTAIFLPITEGTQREAAERLSVVGHLKHDPELLWELLPSNESLWGLADLSFTLEGREVISTLTGANVTAPDYDKAIAYQRDTDYPGALRHRQNAGNP